MENFEAILEKAFEKGSNIVPGAAMAVVNEQGKVIYKNVKGFNGAAEDASPLEFDQVYCLASCTKLVTSIAALQLVERKLIGMDDPLDEYIPELTSQSLIKAGDGDAFTLSAPTKKVTLRHLLTHSSGAAYDVMVPPLASWRQSRGEAPGFAADGDVAKKYAMPRVFESGEGWMYGTGLDWVSLLIARLTKKGFGDYVEENIAKPLGADSFTWYPKRDPDVEKKIMPMSERKEDGTFTKGQTPILAGPYEAGGAGMYSNVTDYALLLADLLKDSPKLLSSASVDLLFTPQFAPDSAAQKDMVPNGQHMWSVNTGLSVEGVDPNHALGGFITTHDIEREEYFKPKGTLCWGGLPNLAWNVNREKGLAMFFATQVIPFGDERTQMLNAAFETAVWRNLSS